MTIDLEVKCKEYKELKRLIEVAQAEADSLADEIKAAMNGEEKIIVGAFKISHTLCQRQDIDKIKLQTEHEALYNAYLKTTSYKRFLVS